MKTALPLVSFALLAGCATQNAAAASFPIHVERADGAASVWVLEVSTRASAMLCRDDGACVSADDSAMGSADEDLLEEAYDVLARHTSEVGHDTRADSNDAFCRHDRKILVAASVVLAVSIWRLLRGTRRARDAAGLVTHLLDAKGSLEDAGKSLLRSASIGDETVDAVWNAAVALERSQGAGALRRALDVQNGLLRLPPTSTTPARVLPFPRALVGPFTDSVERLAGFERDLARARTASAAGDLEAFLGAASGMVSTLVAAYSYYLGAIFCP